MLRRTAAVCFVMLPLVALAQSGARRLTGRQRHRRMRSARGNGLGPGGGEFQARGGIATRFEDGDDAMAGGGESAAGAREPAGVPRSRVEIPGIPD